MGGDEFVVVARGLPPETVVKKADQLRELAKHAGHEVCGEDILSLSVGQALYPKDGQDAEELLAEADRRMYIEKQQQPSRKNRRLYPRMKCRVTIELRQQEDDTPVLGNLDRKSTRLNSSHVRISYAVFCLKKKNNTYILLQDTTKL